MSSNLTNLVLAGAFSISFPTFTAYMVLPFLAAAIMTYPVFLIMFRGREYIPRTIDIQGEEATLEPSSVLVDKWGAIFGSVLLTATLGVLVGTSILRVPVWQITVPPAVIMFVRDVVYDWYTSHPVPQPESIEMEGETVTSQTGPTACVPRPQGSQNGQGFWKYARYVAFRFPTATTVLRRLPVGLVVFALSTFVLVQGLTRTGWVEVFANGWAWWARNTGLVGVTAGMGIIACILCDVSRFRFFSTPYPTILPDMWNQHWSDDLFRTRSSGLDHPDGGFDRPKATRRCHLHARDRIELWGIHAHSIRFAGRAPVEEYLEAKRGSGSQMAILQTESSFGCCFNGCVVRCHHWGDVCGTQELEICFTFASCTFTAIP